MLFTSVAIGQSNYFGFGFGFGFTTLNWKLLYIYALLTKREVKMAGYWPSSFFAFLWTETKSRSIKTQKKNEANIQPS